MTDRGLECITHITKSLRAAPGEPTKVPVRDRELGVSFYWCREYEAVRTDEE